MKNPERYVNQDQSRYVPRVIDKRGGVSGDGVAAQPNAASTPGETVVAAGDAPSAPPAPSAEVAAAIAKIDFLKEGDQFIVRDVTYRVVSVLQEQNAVLCAPVSLGRATLKAMRKAGRS